MSDLARLKGITARFAIGRGGFSLDVELALPGSGVTALFGASGSGKTTILRCLAGLERASGGFLAVGNAVWQDEARQVFLPPHRRAAGVVFQEASLFPHLSVMGNLTYGMTRAGLSPEEAGLESILDLLGIAGLTGRDTASLSGGERQRVAIARALLRRPRMLLMDEPLAALDQQRKAEILPFLERLHDELDIPIVYVSHAPEELARLADHLVLLDAGRVVGAGPIGEMMGRIDLAPGFADDLGSLLVMRVAAHEDDDITRLDFAGGSLVVGRQDAPVGKAMRCRIFAGDVSLSLSHHTDMSISNIYPATVHAIGEAPVPGQVLVETRLAGGERLLARITRRSAQQLGLQPGAPVWAQVKAVALLRD